MLARIDEIVEEQLPKSTRIIIQLYAQTITILLQILKMFSDCKMVQFKNIFQQIRFQMAHKKTFYSQQLYKMPHLIVSTYFLCIKLGKIVYLRTSQT